MNTNTNTKDDKIGKAIAGHMDWVDPGYCPTADLLSAFAEHKTTGAETSVVYDHIASCARCREILYIVGSLEAAPAVSSAGRSWIKTVMPYAAAASLVLAVGIAYIQTRPGDEPGRPLVVATIKSVAGEKSEQPQAAADMKPATAEKSESPQVVSGIKSKTVERPGQPQVVATIKPAQVMPAAPPTAAGSANVSEAARPIRPMALVAKNDMRKPSVADEYYYDGEDDGQASGRPKRRHEEQPAESSHGVLYAMATIDAGRISIVKSLDTRRTITDADEIEEILSGLKVKDREMRDAIGRGVDKIVIIGMDGAGGRRQASLKLKNGTLTITLD